MYTSQQMLHKTSLHQINKLKNTESAAMPFIPQENTNPDKKAFLNSITDDSELGEKPIGQHQSELGTNEEPANPPGVGSVELNDEIRYNQDGIDSKKLQAMVLQKRSTFSLKFGDENESKSDLRGKAI